MGTDSLYLKRNPIPPDLRTPLSGIGFEYNLTVLQTPVFLRQSVDLMRRMIPGMKEVWYSWATTCISTGRTNRNSPN